MLAPLELQRSCPYLVPFAIWTCVLTVPHTHEPSEKKFTFFDQNLLRNRRYEVHKGMKEFTTQISQPVATREICWADTMDIAAPIPFSTLSLLVAKPTSSNFPRRQVKPLSKTSQTHFLFASIYRPFSIWSQGFLTWALDEVQPDPAVPSPRLQPKISVVPQRSIFLN